MRRSGLQLRDRAIPHATVALLDLKLAIENGGVQSIKVRLRVGHPPSLETTPSHLQGRVRQFLLGLAAGR